MESKEASTLEVNKTLDSFPGDMQSNSSSSIPEAAVASDKGENKIPGVENQANLDLHLAHLSSDNLKHNLPGPNISRSEYYTCIDEYLSRRICTEQCMGAPTNRSTRHSRVSEQGHNTIV